LRLLKDWNRSEIHVYISMRVCMYMCMRMRVILSHVSVSFCWDYEMTQSALTYNATHTATHTATHNATHTTTHTLCVCKMTQTPLKYTCNVYTHEYMFVYMWVHEQLILYVRIYVYTRICVYTSYYVCSWWFCVGSLAALLNVIISRLVIVVGSFK